MAQITQIKATESEVDYLEKYAPVTKLGIQGNPKEVKFKLNRCDSIIQIGESGIYELDLTDIGYINSLEFVEGVSEENPVLIDIIYHGKGEEMV
jgi:hypothetical protein